MGTGIFNHISAIKRESLTTKEANWRCGDERSPPQRACRRPERVNGTKQILMSKNGDSMIPDGGQRKQKMYLFINIQLSAFQTQGGRRPPRDLPQSFKSGPVKQASAASCANFATPSNCIRSGASADRRTLNKMACSAETPLRQAGCPFSKPFHPCHQIGLGRLHHQVKVVGHQTKRMNLPIGFATAFGQRFQKPFPVGIILEDWLAPVAAIHYMINRPSYSKRILRAIKPMIPKRPKTVKSKD